MTKVLKIEVSSGEVMLADFLIDKAPKTCDALMKALPYQQKTLTHGRWSGHAVYIYTDLNLRIAECSRSYGVAPGDILYNPHVVDSPIYPNELIFVYGPSAIRNEVGYGIANLCARIRPEYWLMLHELGIDINRHGEREVTLSLLEE